MSNRITRWTFVAIFAVVAILAAVPARAGEINVLLEPVDPTVKMSGVASLMTKGKQEIFMTRVFADLPNGTVLTVGVVNGKETSEKGVAVGKLVIRLGSGLLYLENTLDVNPVFPLSKVNEVFVFRGEKILLHGLVIRGPR